MLKKTKSVTFFTIFFKISRSRGGRFIYKKVSSNIWRNHLRPVWIPSLLKAEIFTSVKKPESDVINAHIFNMLNFFKKCNVFWKKSFRSPGYTKPSVQSVTFLRRLSRLPASHPALPGISRCKTRRELKFPRCGNAHISSNTLAYAGAGWLLPLLLRGLYLLHIQYAGFFVFGTLFLNFFIFLYIAKSASWRKFRIRVQESCITQKNSCRINHRSFLSLLLHFSYICRLHCLVDLSLCHQTQTFRHLNLSSC